MRVLSQGQMDLFDLAFSRLVGLELNRFRKLFYGRNARPVAMACHGAGIDRSVFSTVFSLSRQAHSLPYKIEPGVQLGVEQVFKNMTRQQALDELRIDTHRTKQHHKEPLSHPVLV